MNDLDADFIDHGIDGTGHCSREGQQVGTGGELNRRWDRPDQPKIVQGDHEEAKDNQANSQGAPD